jgi:hypothetical protein
MDLTPYFGWIVFAHVLAVFVFAAAHGVTMFVAFRLRRETDRLRIGALLDASTFSLNIASGSLVVVLLAGILAGIVAGSWNRGWIWLSLVLFVGIGFAMTPIGGAWFNRLRVALGQRVRSMRADAPNPVAVTDGELAAILVSRVPETLLLVGGGGFAVILYLMMFRPF